MSANSDGSTFNTEITADPGQFQKGMKDAATAAQGAAQQIDAQFKKIGDTFTRVNTLLVGFTAVLAGGGALRKFINDANDWNGASGRMANQLGITTQQASVLNVALTRLGIDSELYTGASQKLSKQINSNAQAFDVLGVKVRDTTGAYRPVTEVMAEVNAKLSEIKNPIEQNIAGMQVYGKGWAEIRTIMRLTTAQMDEAKAKAEQLNLVVGPEGVAMSKQYTLQMRDLGLVGKSLEVQFGNHLLPVFTSLGAVMSQNVTPIAKAMGTVLETLVVLGLNVSFVFTQMAKDIGASAEAFKLMQKWDFSGARNVLNARASDAANARVKVDWQSQQALGQGAGGGRGFVNPGNAAVPSLGPRYNFKPEKADAAAADPSRMAAWEAELAQRKVVLERQGLMEGQFREMSRAAELAYWQGLSGQAKLSETERIALKRKTAETEMGLIRNGFEVQVKALQAQAEAYKHNTDERMRLELQIQAKYAQGTKEYEESQKRVNAIERQSAEQAKAVAQLRVDAERDARRQIVALEEQAAHQALQLGLITTAQLLEMEQGFEARRFDLANQALQERLHLAEQDTDRNPVEIARINGAIEQLEQQHQLRLGEIRGQAAAESAHAITSTLGSIQSGWANLIAQLAQGTLSIGGFVRGVFATVATAVVQTLASMAAKWMIQKASLLIFGKVTTLSEIAGESAKAGAGGVASMAAAPFPLNLSAPAFGAAMAGAAMAFAPIASAAGGYDIPGTLNPIVQTHAREMILPAKYADVIRQQADGGAGGGGGQMTVTLVAHPMPGNYFMVHRDQLVKALQSAQRDNAWRPA